MILRNVEQYSNVGSKCSNSLKLKAAQFNNCVVRRHFVRNKVNQREADVPTEVD